jgi:CubicO group peptidase (beta-lactamase class C family)
MAIDLGRFIDLFSENFDKLGELGASICIWHNGSQVLNLADGFWDREKTVPWSAQTPVLIWSATKGLASACLLHALSRQNISLERRVVDFWPEYDRNGKGQTTLLHVLSHQAGQPALRDDSISVLDHQAVAEQLAAQEPFWVPGEAHGYHPRTFGFLVDELLRRITQCTDVGAYFRETFTNPFKLDLWIGAPESVLEDIAPIYAPRKARTQNKEEDRFYETLASPGSLASESFSTPAGFRAPSLLNDPKIRMHPIPSFGGIGTAQSLAQFYYLFGSGDLLDANTIEQVSKLQCSGEDRVLLIPTAFGAGFMKDPVENHNKTRSLFGPALTAFGQPGAGGSNAFFDPEHKVAFAYVMNQMEPGLFPNQKSLRIVKEFYDRCL